MWIQALECLLSSYLRDEEKLLRRWRWRSVRNCRLRSENKSLCYSMWYLSPSGPYWLWDENEVCVCVAYMFMCGEGGEGVGGLQLWPWRRRWVKYYGWKRRAQVLERSSWEASVAKFTVIEGWVWGLHISLASRQWRESVCVCECMRQPLHKPVSKTASQSERTIIEAGCTLNARWQSVSFLWFKEQ